MEAKDVRVLEALIKAKAKSDEADQQLSDATVAASLVLKAAGSLLIVNGWALKWNEKAMSVTMERAVNVPVLVDCGDNRFVEARSDALEVDPLVDRIGS